MTLSSRRNYLTPAEQRALLGACHGLFVRDHTLFSLALGAGLSGRSIHALDVGHVSADSERIREGIVVAQPDGRIFAANDNCAVALSEHLRRVLGFYLKWRKSLCHHFQTPMRTFHDTTGVERCATCNQRADIMKLPLFTSRIHERLSIRRMRSLFASYRDELRMPQHLHFDSLRATFRSRHVDDLDAA